MEKNMKNNQKIINRKVKATIFLIVMMFIITLFCVNFVTANSLYQENANSTNVTYTNDFTPSIGGYFYMNYSKPLFSNSSKWEARFGYDGSNVYYENYTIPLTCYNYNTEKLILRFVSIGGGGASQTSSYGQCYNGTWNRITNLSYFASGGSGYGSYSPSNYLRFFDEDFLTGVKAVATPPGWQICSGLGDECAYGQIYEEAMWWNISEVNFIENSQTFNNITTETSAETFILNITYDTTYYQTSLVNLIYNGTTYSSTTTTSGINTIFTTSLNIPSITGTQQNRSFYWNIALTNLTGTYYFNSTFNNQTVNSINLGECTGTTIYKALNITAWNEKTLLRVNLFDLKGTLTYSSSIGGSQKNYSFTNSSIAEKDICININGTLYLNGLLEYSNSSFQTKNYYFLDYPVSNATTNLKLYMLPTTSSTSFIIKVQDTNILPLPNYYVSIFRYDAGNETPYLVQVVKTDLQGQSIAFFETETVDYKFLIYDTNGNLVYTSDKQKIIPQETPYTIVFTVGTDLPNPISYLNNLTGLTYTLGYDKPTFLVTYTYTDTNTSFVSSQLIVSKSNLTGTDTTICSISKTDTSGVITCDLTGNESGNYYATAYITRGSQIFIYRINFEIETFSDTAGLLGVLGAFFILLIAGFIFSYNEVASIISLNIGIIALNIIGITHFGLIFITSTMAISILLLIVLERG
jgi:hypothetical protein